MSFSVNTSVIEQISFHVFFNPGKDPTQYQKQSGPNLDKKFGFSQTGWEPVQTESDQNPKLARTPAWTEGLIAELSSAWDMACASLPWGCIDPHMDHFVHFPYFQVFNTFVFCCKVEDIHLLPTSHAKDDCSKKGTFLQNSSPLVMETLFAKCNSIELL